MPITPKKREQWLNQWPKKTQEGFKANPYLEWIIQSYMQNLLNGVRNGGQVVTNETVTPKTEETKVEIPASDPVVEDDDDDDDDVGGIFDFFD